MTLPQSVKIVEVGPRDGLQNESQILDVEEKISLIEGLMSAGLQHIEVGSFVSPRWVPQMANSDLVYQKIAQKQNIHFPVLVPNDKGLETAITLNVQEISCFTAASETFNQKNVNCSIEQSLSKIAGVVARAKSQNIPVRAYVSCVVACPYEGPIDAGKVREIVQYLLSIGCYEISLGDTIGAGTPAQIHELLDVLYACCTPDVLALHLHDTYGQALANIYASLQRGIHVFDSAIAGLGGCPYARGASGNVATEDLVYMLDGLNIHSGVHLETLVGVGQQISRTLQRENQSKVGKARAGES